MTSSCWFDGQFSWLFDSNQYEVGSSGAHQISDISSTDISDPICRQIYDAFCKLPEVGDYQISDISSTDISDPICRQINDAFCKLSEVGDYGGHQISDISSTDISDPICRQVNDAFCKLSEVGDYGGHQVSDISSTDISDPICRQINDAFCRSADDSELTEVVGSESNRISDYFSIEKLDQIFEKLNELFQWGDDSEQSEVGCSGGNQINDVYSGNKIDLFFENFNEHFLWVDDSEITRNEFGLPAEKLFDDDVMDINDIFRQLNFDQSVEPDLEKEEPKQEEEDVYLRCRKGAIKMLDIATRLSKASKDAYARGDHTSAKKFSLKAREAWKAGHRLNAGAARKILKTVNRKNGIMKLDLHGLHASEATDAVKKRLTMIETIIAKALRASHPDGHSMGKPRCLEVITGIGKHSRGVATLPNAVRTFLAKNGYQFDAGRPGVIMVRPKLRTA